MDDMESLIKETYCLYGLAYYQSEVLHRGLCNAYAFLTFQDVSHITRARFEEKLSEAFSMTLGQLIAHIKDLFPHSIQSRLDKSLEQRNFLAHHFWFDRVHLMYSPRNLLGLHGELSSFASYFEDLDTDINEFLRPIRERVGVTDEVIETEHDALMMGEIEEPLLSQRKLKKRERIVAVWLAQQYDGAITHVFESNDGVLWQLCDIGLGWTRFEKPSPSWSIDERIQKYLPADINPRPNIEKPWNYEFTLADGAVFWVKLSEKERKYYCGIRIGEQNLDLRRPD
jgi:hypothetical protein